MDAYVRGYHEALEAGSDWILEIDAGFSHRPSDIPQFFAAMQRGCDCAFESRFLADGSSRSSLKRYFISCCGAALTNAVLCAHLHNMASGFEMFSHGALPMGLERSIRSRAMSCYLPPPQSKALRLDSMELTSAAAV